MSNEAVKFKDTIPLKDEHKEVKAKAVKPKLLISLHENNTIKTSKETEYKIPHSSSNEVLKHINIVRNKMMKAVSPQFKSLKSPKSKFHVKSSSSNNPETPNNQQNKHKEKFITPNFKRLPNQALSNKLPKKSNILIRSMQQLRRQYIRKGG